MNYQFTDNISDAAHDDFVRRSPMCDILQSSSWAKVKNNWQHRIVAVKKENEVIASALVLYRELLFGYTMFYLPRGPIMDYDDHELVSFFLTHLKQFARSEKCIYITIDPGIIHREELFNCFQESEERNERDILRFLKQQGCHFKGLTKDFSSTIQSRYHAGIYSHDGWEEKFEKRAKKALALTRNKKINIRYCGQEGIDEFIKVIECTEKRKHIQLRDASYFRTILQAYGNDAVITLAQLPVHEVMKDIDDQIHKLNRRIAKIKDEQNASRLNMEQQATALHHKRVTLQEDLERYGDPLTIAGALSVRFHGCAEILYAGMNDRYKRYMAPYTVFYHSFTWAFDKGCTWCNMGGIEGSMKGGLIEFKSSFQPTIREYIGEFDIILHPVLYKAIRFATAMRKKIKMIKQAWFTRVHA